MRDSPFVQVLLHGRPHFWYVVETAFAPASHNLAQRICATNPISLQTTVNRRAQQKDTKHTANKVFCKIQWYKIEAKLNV
jgi:hypothetical protein